MVNGGDVKSADAQCIGVVDGVSDCEHESEESERNAESQNIM